MDSYEYLRQYKSAKQRYKEELASLADKFITSNFSFKKGDIVEVKNICLSGRFIIDDIHLIIDGEPEDIQSPSNIIHCIWVNGRKLNTEGKPSAYSNRFRATDIIK